MTISYIAFKGSESGQVVRAEITRRDLQPHEVLVKMMYSGVCATDQHFLTSNMVLGHEGVGVVKEVGAEVRNLTSGDIVGIGYARGGCGSCAECQLGYNYYCENRPNNYGAHDFDTATWATHAILPSVRLAKIPETIPAQVAGPLVCAGQTVWLPFAKTDIRPWHTVGVVGLGGLGHLAVQFASKMGWEVAVFSGSDSKRDEAFQLGATAFYTTADLKSDEMRKHLVNHLLVTTSELPDWQVYEPVLANRSHVFPLTITPADFKLNAITLVVREITVQGIAASTMTQMNDMLAFTARHKIRPMVEEFPLTSEGIKQAMEKLQAGKLRYRAVLKAGIGT